MNFFHKLKNRISPFLNLSKIVVVPISTTSLRVWVNPSHGYVDRHLFWEKKYAPHITRILQDLVKPEMVVADVGANIGFFAVLMGTRGATVYAFEPSQRIANLLYMNVLENNLNDRVKVCRVALSSEGGAAELTVSKSELGQSSLGKHVKGVPEVVDLCTLDDFMAERDIKKMNLIKLDVEGHEYRVLMGARKTIEKHRPIIIHELSVELSPENALEQLNILSQLGYKHSVILRSGKGVFDFDCSNEEYVHRMHGKQRDILSIHT